MDDLIHLEPNEMAIVMVKFDTTAGVAPMAVFDEAEEAEKYYQYLVKFYEEADDVQVRWVAVTPVPHYTTAEEAFLADKADEESGITEDFDYYLSGGY